ncbi:MAG: ATP-binding protein, partial [bacterium]
MHKEKIIEILNSWNFWQKIPETGMPRKDYLDKMAQFDKTSQIVSIVGVRRSGKSTLMLQYIKKLIDNGLPVKNTLYVNLEDPRFLGELSVKLLQDIYEAYLEYLEPSKPIYLFLDEAQNVPAWEKFVRSLHEKKEAKIFVSGSSSKLLSSEFGTVLTGRHLMLMVYPLNFKEFLEFKNLEIKSKLDLINQKLKIKRLLKEYLEFGGFPKVVLSESKREILINYFNDIISKDIVERHKIRKVEKLKTLAKYYLTNISSLIAFNRIKKFISLPIDTIERFSYFLTYPYLIFFAKKFAYSLKEQEVNPRKTYCIDTGLRNAVCFRFSEDIGKLYENLVFLKLINTEQEIYYWKNKGECDFIIKKGKTKQAVQVCYDM